MPQPGRDRRALLLRASLADTKPTVTALLDAIVAQLTADGRRH